MTSQRILAEDLARSFHTETNRVDALGPLSTEIVDREFVSIVGPSGCGKSTFLRVVGGLIRPSKGRVRVVDDKSGRPLTGFVFQDYSVFPWKTVLQNVAWTLRVNGRSRSEANAVAMDWVCRVGLENAADQYPATLSGGMRQRVAIARAFASNPQILLMDEPFAALDAQMRRVMQEELAGLCEAEPRTVVFVTHSIAEAILLSDTILVMSARPGRIIGRYDVPLERPRTTAASETPEARDLHRTVWEHLEEEVTRTMAERSEAAVA